jgi:hypothetical protein
MSYSIQEVINEDKSWKKFLGVDPHGVVVTDCLLDRDGYIRAFSLSDQVLWYGENKGQKLLFDQTENKI